MYTDLINLIRENPTLQVIPLVDADVVADDSGRWCGSFGNACIKEYILFEMYNDWEDLVYKDDTEDYENYLYDHDDEGYFNEETMKKHLENIIWKKAIFVNIDLPN